MNTAKGMYVNGNPVYFKDDNVRNFISDEYSEDKTYAVGDYCINNNKLYMCTAPTSGGFDGSCWKQTNMSAEVSEQNNKLGGLSFYSCTQSQYDGMSSHDSNTIYFIKG